MTAVTVTQVAMRPAKNAHVDTGSLDRSAPRSVTTAAGVTRDPPIPDRWAEDFGPAEKESDSEAEAPVLRVRSLLDELDVAVR
jgi:hypothetical protein